MIQLFVKEHKTKVMYIYIVDRVKSRVITNSLKLPGGSWVLIPQERYNLRLRDFFFTIRALQLQLSALQVENI